MALVTTTEMFKKAYEGGYAIGAFNINNMEIVQGITEAAHELNSPVILQASKGARAYANSVYLVKLVEGALALYPDLPVALHLDHGSFEGAKACINAGFSSIMFDGSHLPFEENKEKTTILKNTCDVLGLSLEAEVGSIGGEEDGVIGQGECADPEECKTIADLGVTMLAAGIGNIHGKYPDNWAGLSFETLEAINKRVNEGKETPMPLVLHGGTGIPDDQIKKAISLGVAKINVNTECQWAFQEATRAYIEAGKDQQGKGFDPRKLLAPGFEAIKAKVKEKMELFGSVGKA
ncbi:MAG: class II fructose-bisphosphate aldolase family protein [Oscillospiraceae bacterium]|nr:class II fructose-bisphosphate aldolase family protein [Oscillospiraceae bacterium]